MPAEETYNLADLADDLGQRFPGVTDLYLFGSRRYRTRSARSDVDILVCHAGHIRPGDLRQFADEYCPALDLFLVHVGKAVSCANESYVEADNLVDLVTRLDAVHFWSRGVGGRIVGADVDWTFSIPAGVDHAMTVLLSGTPMSGRWSSSVRSFMSKVEQDGFPVLPYVGSNAEEATALLIEVTRRAVASAAQLTPRGTGLRADLITEYDFQNLFFLTIKPWLPELGREEVTIQYDGQEKVADFNLFKSKIVIELKHIRDASTKAAVVKTLEGLSTFYSQHPNVQVLLIAVLVSEDVELDGPRWEKDFSYTQQGPKVVTIVVRAPYHEDSLTGDKGVAENGM